MTSEQSNKRNPDLSTKFRASHANTSRPRSKNQKSTPKRARSECCEEATTSVDDDDEEDVTGETVVSGGEEHLVSFVTNPNGYYASPTAPGVVTTTPLNEKNCASMIYDFPSHHHHHHHHYLQSHNNQINNNSVQQNHHHIGDQIIASSTTNTSDNLILDLEFDHYYAPHGQDVATFSHADYNSIS